MKGFVEVYDKATGKKLPHPVPERLVNHPVWGRNYSLTPREKARTRANRRRSTDPAPEAQAEQASTTETPAVGDDNEGVTPHAEDNR